MVLRSFATFNNFFNSSVGDLQLATFCPEIKWHYIGMYQTKMANQLMRVPRLHMLETLSSRAQADAVNTRWRGDQPLRVLVQVNTSGEESKMCACALRTL